MARFVARVGLSSPVMAKAVRPSSRDRGNIELLPSGALRVRVYAGQDPVTKRRHSLVETVPAGPKAWERAEEVRLGFLADIRKRRNPRTTATVNQLLDRYLDQHTGGRRTVEGYREYVDKHVRPFIGMSKVGSIDAEILDSLYAEMRRCREHCRDRRGVDHRTSYPHECDARCRPHRCRPLGAATIRKIHYILSGAYKRAVRWRWVGSSPMDQGEPPPVPSPDPQPPTPEEAARLVAAAWRRDADWGMFVWLMMVTGARRGEVCGLRWRYVNLERGVLTIRRAIAEVRGETEEKDTKTHQRRHVTIDPGTVEALQEHRRRWEERCAALETELSPDAYVFSSSPTGQKHLTPSSVTQRYSKMADRLGIDTHLHNLRHYSATELIAGGVDVRTVAGRLGHGGGGTTTLRVYAAWVAEADQRAAQGLADRLPERPAPSDVDDVERARTDPRYPFEHIAMALRDRIAAGGWPVGAQLPTGKQLGVDFGVSTATAQRAVALLQAWELVEVSRGRRPVVLAPQA
ncbi:tyrosine-type recombinase/integrase [Actinomycetospora sp. CA-101289]|uniref:tyrosine-type recombinase/integrase n=1 Tax=Actinomycetospora sp. CA-101289 TaxID=3239893 RepID=UPI003D986F03